MVIPEVLNLLLIAQRIISSVPVLSKSRYVLQPSAELVKKIVATQPAIYKSPSVPQPSVDRVKKLFGIVLSYETKPQTGRLRGLVRLLHRARYVNPYSRAYELYC